MNVSRLARAALLVAAVATVTAPTRRAEAVTVVQVASGLKKAYDLYQKYKGGQLTLQQATDQILNQIEAAKVAVLARVDGIAAAEGRACARSTIINAGDMDAASLQVREQLAFDAVDCLSRIEALLETVEDRPAVDKLGFALNALGPVVLMARAGFSDNPDITDLVINGNYAVVAKLFPHCVVMELRGDSEGDFVEKNIRCTAYNRDRGYEFSWTGDPQFASKKTKAEDRATRNTSRAIAQAVLPGLLAPPQPPPRRWWRPISIQSTGWSR